MGKQSQLQRRLQRQLQLEFDNNLQAEQDTKNDNCGHCKTKEFQGQEIEQLIDGAGVE